MKDKLWELICTLNAPEIRYFKQFASRSHAASSKNYLILFDELLQLKTNNENVLIERLQKKNVNTQFLAADKNYLYSQILRSLQSYHAHSSSVTEICGFLTQLDILYQKGLYESCKKIISKAQKIANQHHLLEYLLILLQWERKIMGVGLDETQAAQLFAQIDRYIDHIKNINDLNALYYQIVGLRKKLVNLRSAIEVVALEKLMQHPILSTITNAKSLAAQIRFYEIYAIYYYLTNQKKQEFLANQSIVNVYDAQQITENKSNYIAHYSRYLSLQAILEPQHFEQSLAYFKQLPAQLDNISPYLTAQVAILATGIAMNHAIKQQDFEAIALLRLEEQRTLQTFAVFMSLEQKSIAYYRLLYTYFMEADHVAALDYANVIINDFAEGTRPDIRFYTRLIQIIIHYERQNYQLLPYLLRYARQAMNKRKSLQESEKIILSFMGKLAHQYPNFDWRDLLMLLRHKLMQVFEVNHFNRIVLNYFDIIAWIDSKSANISFKEALLQARMDNNKSKE